MSFVSAEGLGKTRSNGFKLKDIDLEIKEGEIVGVLGPNGAGKSTLMDVLTGQLRRDKGDLQVLGKEPSNEAIALRSEIGILPEREDPPSFLTGHEYLDFVSDIREEKVDDSWSERLNITGKLGQLTKDISKGERQKLMVIQAFFHRPKLVFIDEPLANLDPLVQEEVKNIFREHRERGGSMLLCTHVIGLAEELCDRAIFIENGEVVESFEDVSDLKNKFIEMKEQ